MPRPSKPRSPDHRLTVGVSPSRVTTEPLTSRSERVKAARRLLRRPHRQAERRFLAEGPQAVREALGVPGCVEGVFATEFASRRCTDLVQVCAAAGVAWRLTADSAVADLSETVTPQGMVAVCRLPDTRLDEVLASTPALVAVCASIRDPGNAGTVIRTADAAGADAVVFAGDCVDPYNGKAVRASAGSLFHLPVITDVALSDTAAAVRAAGLQQLAADGAGATTLDDVRSSGQLTRPTAWVFGNEAWGMPAVDLARADSVVRVPIYGRAESLNLATAAALCLYASASAQRKA
jgi:RNA methyltransferase, TrmH family